MRKSHRGGIFLGRARNLAQRQPTAVGCLESKHSALPHQAATIVATVGKRNTEGGARVADIPRIRPTVNWSA